ncbi:TetR/AcrR family transcriptional regulator [Egibacter rhizosphaerae]|uniref:TetR/AcrR family transcriptional regulator n=1 Tax=Egibacter rhizosphaerae TaxID=1670831 RepID=A0A411YFJ2_9ACTN|nr:TetR/AcrR family transcriptional regulator [Egibacter rhizosphaerae]QBI19877.1 TetR/AcrR family transcriptional regulator [Egibacter rhizosphaerae]
MPRAHDYPDDLRVLQLLWRREEAPSARSGLTVSRIVEAAVDIADREGLKAVTMRRVAQGLGVSTMSLYNYVPGKEELAHLMFDHVYGEVPAGVPGDGDWRAGLEEVARGLWALHERHPWLVDLPLTRPLVGPNAVDRWEEQLRVVDGIGLAEVEMNAVLELVYGHVDGMARRRVEISRDAERSGMTDDEWWEHVFPVFTRVLADRDLAVSARVGEAVGAPHTDPELVFEFGLARILDGVAALLERRGTNSG